MARTCAAARQAPSGGGAAWRCRSAPARPLARASTEADHSRRPVVKDERRAKRTAEKKPRAKAVGGPGGKKNPAAPVPVKKKEKSEGKAKAGDKMEE